MGYKGVPVLTIYRPFNLVKDYGAPFVSKLEKIIMIY